MAGNATARGVPRRLIQGDGIVPVIGAGQIPTIQYSSGAARALQQFGRDLFNVSAGFEDQLDREAEAEATTRGAIAGASGDFDLQSYATIRGRAFNKAAVETFTANVDTASIVKLNELQSQFWNDPAGLDKAWKEWRAGYKSELMRFSPERAAEFDNRAAIRGLPAIEQAKDTAYKLTRSEADAALIANEASLRAEIKSNAADLFSQNPERSAAAARAIQMVGNDYRKIYNAVDPTTGRPLYSPEERAKAMKAFQDVTMTNATLAWFDEQPDKAGAYLKFLSGDFKFNLRLGGGYQGKLPAGMRNNNPGNIKYVGQSNALGPSENTDQGDPQAVYATAEEGMGAMLDLLRKKYQGGKVTPNQIIADKGGWTPGNYQAAKNVARNAGIGPDDDINLNDPEAAFKFMRGLMLQEHGKASAMYSDEMVWNAINGKPLEARAAGTDLRGMTSVQDQEFSVLDSLTDEARNSLDAEMRSRISFANSMRDREETIAKARMTAKQELTTFDFSTRIFAAGQTDPATGKPIPALTLEEVQKAVRNGDMKPSDGEAAIKAMNTERPETSDLTTYREILRRLYSGEDIRTLVFEAGEKLSSKDAAELLSKNQSVNKTADGGFSKEQQFAFDNILKKRLGSRGMFDAFDQGKADREAMAYEEYRRRVMDPENVESPDQIANDIANRAAMSLVQNDAAELAGLIRPRFSVRGPMSGQIDISASRAALTKALDEKRITEMDAIREGLLLQKWEMLQNSVNDNRKETTK